MLEPWSLRYVLVKRILRAAVLGPIKILVKIFGFSLVHHEDMTLFREKELRDSDLLFLETLAERFDINKSIRLLGKSKSQLRQDLLVLALLDYKESGFFVEFGATDGVTLSNTWLLENEFGWTGILSEPAKTWHQDLQSNRSARIDSRCVWSDTGKILEFQEAAVPELSSVSTRDASQHFVSTETRGRQYLVETVSLAGLLTDHEAPTVIDYLSIDTEGSEYEILKGFDFNKFFIRVITVEHNFSCNRELVSDLLVRNGFTQVFPLLSKWDDWFVNRDSEFSD